MTRGAPHVRDAIDVKRVMITVVSLVLPCALFGMYNVGHQANLALAQLGLEVAERPAGRGARHLRVRRRSPGFLGLLRHGALYFLPIYVVTMMAGGLWEALFASVRNHEINEGFLVTSMLFRCTLPPTIPLWQVAVGISFGVVIGKEVFGGTGMNIFNPALTGRAFLYFAYPAQISGDGGRGAGPRLHRRDGSRRRPHGDLEAVTASGHHVGRCLRGLHAGLDRRDLGARVPARRGVPGLHRHRFVADHARRCCSAWW